MRRTIKRRHRILAVVCAAVLAASGVSLSTMTEAIGGTIESSEEKEEAVSTGYVVKKNIVYETFSDGTKTVATAKAAHKEKISGKVYIVNKTGKLTKGWKKVGKNKYYCKKAGIPVSGIQKINQKYYFFKKNGVNAKKNVTEKKVEYYINAKGLLIGYRRGSSYYLPNKKKMSKTRAEEFKTFLRAQKVVNQITKSSMTKGEKLKVCFDYCKQHYKECSPRSPHYLGTDWPTIYANDMFVRGMGNCCSYGACFAFMAKAIGYEDVYVCNSGGHGWAEVNGKVYDPEWSKTHHRYSYYALSYDAKTDVKYKKAIAAKKKWMHVYIH